MSKNTQLGNLVNGIYVDSTGKVGVGTTSPSELLTISAVQPNSVINYTSASDYGRIYFSEAGTFKASIQFMGSTFAATSRRNALEIVNTTTGDLALGTGDARTFYIKNGGNVGIGTSIISQNFSGYTHLDIGNSTTGGILLFSNAGGTNYGYVNADSGGINMRATVGNITFNSGASERMRILSNGNVLIGNTTDSGDRLRVTGSIASNGTSAGMFFQNRAAGNFLGFYADNTSTFLIYNTNVGNIATINQSNGNYTALSDVNKKKDFEQSNIGLNEVLQLKPTLYRMKTDDESSAKELGFIAQEVKEFIPQAYSESGEGEDKFIGLNQMPLIAALTKAIQELKAEIDILKNK